MVHLGMQVIEGNAELLGSLRGCTPPLLSLLLS
jgi:hypothetical protein